MRLLKENPTVDLVILSASWTMLSGLVSPVDESRNRADGVALVREGLEQLLNEASAPGRRFVIVADVPVFPSNPLPCVVSSITSLWREMCTSDLGTLNKKIQAEQQQDVALMIKEIAARRHDTMAVLPAEGLCDAVRCVNTLNGEFLYRDVSHFRRNLQSTTLRELANLSGISAALLYSPGKGKGSARGRP